MTDRIERPYALLRHHAGSTVVFHVRSETGESVTGFHTDREPAGQDVTYNARAVLARFASVQAAEAAREAALAEWRRHEPAVREAEARLRQAEKVRENAWRASLGAAEG